MNNVSIYTILHENVKIYDSVSYEHIKRLWKSLIADGKSHKGYFTLMKDNEVLFEVEGL